MNFSPLSMTLRTLHPDQTTSATKCLNIMSIKSLWKSCYSCLTKSGSPAKFLHPGYSPLLSLFQSQTNLRTYRLSTAQYPWPAMFVSFSKKYLCRLKWFLEYHNVFHISQSGFRQRRNTTDHLVRLHDAIHKSMAWRTNTTFCLSSLT